MLNEHKAIDGAMETNEEQEEFGEPEDMEFEDADEKFPVVSSIFDIMENPFVEDK